MGQVRIIAGKHRGRSLNVPETADIRPTGSRTREAIFNILLHGHFDGGVASPLIGQHVLDVFCGSGAFALEALSRGAKRATCIDKSRESLRIAAENAAKLGETAQVHCLLSDAAQLPKALPTAHDKATLALLDPPYHTALGEAALTALAAQGWLERGAICVLELAEKQAFTLPASFTLHSERHYGNTRVLILVWGSAA